eukprot:gene34918-43058_t
MPCSDESVPIPRLEILNTRSCEVEKDTKLFNTKTGDVFQILKYRVVLREILELHRFPFDRQMVKVNIQCFSASLVAWPALARDDIPKVVAHDPLWGENEHVVEYLQDAWLL